MRQRAGSEAVFKAAFQYAFIVLYFGFERVPYYLCPINARIMLAHTPSNTVANFRNETLIRAIE